MEMSPQINELATALSAFQGEMKAVPFDATNPFFKSKYATLSALVDNASPLLFKHGLSVSQLVSEDGAVETILMHKSGQFISSKVKLTPTKTDPQGVGSAITYARRYQYAAILGLVSEADDDGNAASVPATTQKVAIPAPAKPFVKPQQDAVSKPLDAPKSHDSILDIEGVLLESNTRVQKRKADGKEFTITDYKIQSKSHGDITISCFGSAVEAETWSNLLFIDVKEREFKGKKELSASKVVVKEQPVTTDSNEIAWEE